MSQHCKNNKKAYLCITYIHRAKYMYSVVTSVGLFHQILCQNPSIAVRHTNPFLCQISVILLVSPPSWRKAFSVPSMPGSSSKPKQSKCIWVISCQSTKVFWTRLKNYFFNEKRQIYTSLRYMNQFLHVFFFSFRQSSFFFTFKVLSAVAFFKNTIFYILLHYCLTPKKNLETLHTY